MLDSFGDFLFKIVKCRFGLGQFCCLQVSNAWTFSWDYMEPEGDENLIALFSCCKEWPKLVLSYDPFCCMPHDIYCQILCA